MSKRWMSPPRPAVALGIALLVATACAVTPGEWNSSTEADFAKGKFTRTVSTSLGEVSLGHEIKVLMPSDSAPAVVSAVAAAGDTLYAAAGNEPVIYRIRGDKAAKFAELPSTTVCCLLWTGRDLLAGTGGEKAGIYRVDSGGRSKPLWVDEKVKYVWAILTAPGGALYAATGPEGKVFAVDKAGKAEVLYHADKLAKNILCLVGGAGKLYAGTDEKGLVLEIDPKAKAGRVLFETPEKEVAALVVGPGGELFAATSDASKASADGAKAPAEAKEGKSAGATRPAAGPTGTTAPATKPAAEPAKAPEPPAGTTQPAEPPRKAEPADKPKDEGKDNPKGEDKDKPKAERPAGESAGGKAPAVSAPADPATGASHPTTRPAATAGAPTDRPAGSPPPTMVRMVRTARPATPPSGAPASVPAPGGPGNAVYLIRPDGLVETVLRRPVTILAMVLRDGKLVLATGNGGQIFTVTPDGDEVALIADTDAKQVTALTVAQGDRIVFATANKGSVGRIEHDLAREGTYVSEAYDAKQIARWGTIQMDGEAPAGASVTVATRTGNVAEPDEKTWSSWSREMALEDGFLALGSPGGRFAQYRLTFTSDGKAAPVVRGVEIIYQVGNLPPAVMGVSVTASDKGMRSESDTGGAKPYRHIDIKAADGNGDPLRVIIAFREIGTDNWVTVTDKLTVPKFVWDTRTVGDGRYEVRVTASDDPANPAQGALTAARISEPVVVDNTAPVVKNLASKLTDGVVTVTGQVSDAASRVVSIQYSVDSQEDWTSVLPSDGLCDSDQERLSFDVKDLKPGAHRIAIRVLDLFGNPGFGALTVVVGK